MRSSLLLLALALGCSSEPASRAEAPLVEDALAQAPLAAGELVLDRRGDARLVGRLEPGVPNGDPDRVLVLRTSGVEGSLDGARVLDARFAGDSVVVLGADHVLRAHRGGQVIELDRQAEPPLSVAGTRVAYVRGEMPFFEVALADVDAGTARQITQGLAPAWAPALSSDGRTIVFASSSGGSPRMYRTSESGAVTPLPPSSRTPSSPDAPRLEGGLLYFRDEQGAAVLELASGEVRE